jgi:hypothetical protein
MTGNERDDGESADGVGRRELLQVAGAASVPALAGCNALDSGATDGESTDGGNGSVAGKQGSSPTLELEPALNLGGRRIVSQPDAVGYDTIKGAWEAASDGDIVFVHSSYDAEVAGEPFPVVFDYREKEVMLTGGHPSGSVIDARHVPDTNVVEIVGKAQGDYRNKALVQHLKIRGGNVGLRIRGATYSTYKDLVVHEAADDGIRVENLVESDGTERKSFGMTFRNVMAWRCGGAGFRLRSAANPHGTTFYGCDSLFNGYEDDAPGVALRGYSSRWVNGVVQNNGGFGIEARDGASQAVKDTYVEGNGMTTENPHGIYVDDSSPGFVLQGSYFQGGYFRSAPNDRNKGFRGIAVVGASGVELSGCTYKNYTDAFVHLRNTNDADVHVASHTALDDTRFQNRGANTRLRSSGLILETDLRGRDPEGRYKGDYGVHDGSGRAPWGLAMWNGERWVSVMDGSVVR